MPFMVSGFQCRSSFFQVIWSGLFFRKKKKTDFLAINMKQSEKSLEEKIQNQAATSIQVKGDDKTSERMSTLS